MRLLAILSATLLAACSTQIYDEAPQGRFSGSLLVMWVGPGDPDAGDGRFVYVPDTRGGAGLAFTRARSPGEDGVNIIRIEPEWMYTDGGSIPRGFQPFRGLNPWSYAPAYMVHDWLFAARKCLRDSEVDPTEAERKVAGVTFRESYEIMAETIKTLEKTFRVSESDVQPRAITWAVSTEISRNLWERRDACERLSKDHEDQVRARLGIGPASRRSTVMMDGRRVRPAEVVAQITF